jgi:uncharacterized protein (DUF305 family)
MPTAAPTARPTLPPAADLDRLFIDMMVPHHQDAVDASRAALQATVRSEIRTLASAIIAAQQSEIAAMRQWQRAWFART